jgi:hypothetical protein
MSRAGDAELARRLIEAGRSERPATALGQRLLILDPAALDGRAPRARRVADRWLRPAWLAAALLASVACLGIGWSLGLGGGRLGSGRTGASSALLSAPLISRERRPPPPAAITTEPAQSSRAEPRPAPTQPAREPARSEVAEPRAAKAEAAKARAAERSKRSSTPAPQASTSDPQRDQPVVRRQVSPDRPTTASPTLAPELALLTQARAALRAGNGQQALALLDRYAATRSSAALDAEATLLRIETLDALGSRARAAELATAFVHDNPNSALADRAQRYIVPARAAAPPSERAQSARERR